MLSIQMCHFSSNQIIFYLIILILIVFVNSDCGCGSRCIDYDGDLQCTRCCTATVRRSVPISDYPRGIIWKKILN